MISSTAPKIRAAMGFAVVLLALVLARPCVAAAAPTVTASGIALNAPWKVKIYELARRHFLHPAWGGSIPSAITCSP